MAEVYKARAVSPEGVERTLVIKKILPEFATNHHFVRMLVAEARVSSMLHHPNIVQTFELGESDGQHYIAMEYVPGPDLLGILTSATRTGLRIPLGLALYVVSEVCNGLDYAHKATDSQRRPLNLIHRDVSPSNILISEDGGVKLMDFGVARADLARPGRQRAVDDTQGSLKGKLGYMSPEQVTGQPVDHRSDLFSLGVVLFETLTLKRLFLGASDPETLNNIRGARLDEKLARHPYIPDGVQLILRRALAQDPSARYPNAASFREALLTYLFDQRLRVTPRTLARFVGDLDWRAPRDSSATSALVASPPDARVESDDIGLDAPLEDIRGVTFTLHPLHASAQVEVAYAEMASLVHRRAIGPLEQISVGGAAPIRFHQLLRLHDFDRLHPSKGDGRPQQEGPSNSLVLTELLYRCIRSGDDWTLHVSDGPRAKLLSVRRGQLVGADSNERNERLGHLMLNRGLLSADQLAQHIIQSAERGLRLGDALVADGTVAPHVLLDILQAQLRTRVLELLGWQSGWYGLYTGIHDNGAMTLQGIDGLDLLTQAARANWTLAILEPLFADRMECTLSLPPDAPHAPPNLPLTPHESRLSARLIEGATVAEVIEGLEAPDRLATLRMLTMRQRTGQLSLSGNRLPPQGTV